jgi:hypothetical protein
VNQTIFRGAETTVQVAVANVGEVGSFQFTLKFNPAFVSAIDVDAGPFLGSTRRTVICLSPSVPPGEREFVCSTLGSSPPGPSGSGILATVTLRGELAGTSALTLDDVILIRVDGVAHPAPTLQGGSITVQEIGTTTPTHTPSITPTFTPTLSPTPCPTTCPTATQTATATLTPTRTNTRTPSSTPTRTYTPSPAPAAVTVRISPAQQLANVSDSVVVSVVADGTSNVGAYQFSLSYDQSKLQFVSIQNSTFLGSTGRSVICMNPSVLFGVIEYSCITLGATPPGPGGTGTLANVTFVAIANGVAPLSLVDIVLDDITGTSLGPFGTQAGVVFVGPTPTSTATPTLTPTPTATGVGGAGEPCADQNGDGMIRAADIALIVQHYGTSDPMADVDGNGIVRVSDILYAVWQYGTNCTR